MGWFSKSNDSNNSGKSESSSSDSNSSSDVKVDQLLHGEHAKGYDTPREAAGDGWAKKGDDGKWRKP